MDVAARALSLLGEKGARPSYGAFDDVVRRGVPRQELDELIARIPVRGRPAWIGELARSGDVTTSGEAGSRAMRLAYVVSLAEDVWGDRSAAIEFLVRPHSGLGGRTPLEAVAEEWSARDVEAILLSIRYGLPA